MISASCNHSVSATGVAADIILLLVSSDFLNSDSCYDIEMKRALERHTQGDAKVITIILKPCLWTLLSASSKPCRLTEKLKPDTAKLKRLRASSDTTKLLNPGIGAHPGAKMPWPALSGLMGFVW